MHDVIIIGAGSAGLTAALYTSRRQLNTLVISKDLGGQAVLTDNIYNYPGIIQVAGMPLMQIFKEQALTAGAKIEFDQVYGIEKIDNHFKVLLKDRELQARTVILAFGLTPRDLNVPGEENFKGKSVFSAATAYGEKFKGQDIMVVGGGNSAFESVLYLSGLARKVYLVHRRDSFRGEETNLQKIKNLHNLEFILNSQVQSIKGDSTIDEVTLINTQTQAPRAVDVSAICVNIGYEASTKWLKDLVNRNAKGHIEIDLDCQTKTPGLFAAGDCTSSGYKQIITSSGEGCKAALKAYEYLLKLSGKRAVLIDWT